MENYLDKYKKVLLHPAVQSLALVSWAVASFYISQIMVIAGLSLLVNAGYPVATSNKVVLMLVVSFLMYAIGLLIAVGIPAWLRHWSFDYLKERLGVVGRPKFMFFVVAVIGYGIYFLLTQGLLWLAMNLIPGFDIAQRQELGFNTLQSWFEVIVAMVTFVVLAPIAEELFFRGFLFGGLKKRMNAGWAAVIASVIFGFAHGQLNVGIDTFGLSLVLCWLYTHAKTIWPAIFLHMFKNAVALSFLLSISPIQ